MRLQDDHHGTRKSDPLQTSEFDHFVQIQVSPGVISGTRQKAGKNELTRRAEPVKGRRVNRNLNGQLLLLLRNAAVGF